MWLLLLVFLNLQTGAVFSDPAAILSNEVNCHFAARAFARQIEEDGVPPLRVLGYQCVRQEQT